ncbi:GAF and ANTAR domain-containing protein [Nocardioides speluncae]|uniref:GAF and ANTAR domain-containing protein n=1 Tax=Nocardioides speluncae TaxID=2670337 RepID=UPI000D688F21|nr:GAF and ANTAR domain-containing protein [Nocardioides speluncae]
MTTVEQLADVFVEVADSLVADFDLIEFLHTVAGHAAELSGGTAVGLVLADEQARLHYMGASDETARLLELIQIQNSEGPCLDCYRSGQYVVNADLAAAGGLWPSFAPQAVARGYLTVHAFPMRLRERVIGAINVFGREPAVLADQEIKIIQALADVATIALIQEQAIARAEVLNEQLQAALNSRVIIEQAKGAIAGTLAISMDDAFELLRSQARRARVPLTEFARDLVTFPERIAGLRDSR